MSAGISSETATVSKDSRADAICQVTELSHRYGQSAALTGVEYTARAGQISALLGPNGSGKTTLFRLLCTLLPVQDGRITIGGVDAASDPLAVRRQIGIVFQSPSLDPKLTVDENIACQGALYGITGKRLSKRRDELLEQFRLTDRRGDFCESLSGGLKRRVELAKGMLHQPSLLLLDEPSTGLDPAARLDLWDALREMAGQDVAVVLTTHILDEAEKADRVAILSEGRMIADGSPQTLRSEMGQGIITIVTSDQDQTRQLIENEFGLTPRSIGGQLRLPPDQPADLVPQLLNRLGDQVQSITIGRPSLEDVFIARTGKDFN